MCLYFDESDLFVALPPAHVTSNFFKSCCFRGAMELLMDEPQCTV